MRPEKIISGGQTGADRATLDWAIAHGVPHGGWCPAGRRAEDGTIGPHYHLRETPAAEYAQRTEWNVRDADATVIFSLAPELTGGSAQTLALARQHGKPVLHLSRAVHGRAAAEMLRQFVAHHQVRVLNVAGPRATHEPGIGQFVTEVLDAAFGG